jgi:signal transduction histidine kinase
MPPGAIIALAAIGVTTLVAASIIALRARHQATATAREIATLRARVSEIAAMAGGLAHEIKNPLSTIGLNAQLLDEAIADLPIEDQERARIARRLGTLTRETERLRGILEDFLDYAGEIRLHRTETELGPLLDELCDFFLPETEKRSIRLRADLPPTKVHADTDVPSSSRRSSIS